MTSSSPCPVAELRRIFEQALKVADPGPHIAEACKQLPGDRYTVVALGKAAVLMANAALAALADGGREVCGGLVVAPEPAAAVELPVAIGSHPVPDDGSERAGRRLIEVVSDSDAPVLALISGGGSALAAVPADGLTLADKREAASLVMAAGASIDELNAVRKHLSAIKGGRLGQLASHGITTLAMSDVVGDDLAVIASGPTVADPSTFAEAVAVCRRYQIWEQLPRPVAEHLSAGERGQCPETPTEVAGEARVVVPIGHAAEQAVAVVAAGGGRARVDPLPGGKVSKVAAELASRLRTLPSGEVWIGFGEPVVEVPSSPGQGGRAHHLAMLLARELVGHSVTVLVAGTDGIDGNSPSAGAVVDGDSWSALCAAGDPQASLAHFDTYPALAAVGATVEIGRTGVNFADLVIAVGSRPS
ncbi:MAG: DUF4147 domain-containing protein [Deltaproteobacteria bacterium]|nr:DUF4147 domain-containing protein [Deltaproteobacteria bacterium]